MMFFFLGLFICFFLQYVTQESGVRGLPKPHLNLEVQVQSLPKPKPLLEVQVHNYPIHESEPWVQFGFEPGLNGSWTTGSFTLATELRDTKPGDLGMGVKQRLSFDERFHQLGFLKLAFPCSLMTSGTWQGLHTVTRTMPWFLRTLSLYILCQTVYTCTSWQGFILLLELYSLERLTLRTVQVIWFWTRSD